MGVTFSLVIGELDTVWSLDPFHLPETDAIITRVLDPVTFAQLHAIVMQCAYEDIIDIYMDNPAFVRDPDNEGLWVYEVPSALVIRLAQLPDDELAQVALAWKNTDEMRDPELTQAWVRNLVSDIRTLCSGSIQQNQRVYLLCML